MSEPTKPAKPVKEDPIAPTKIRKNPTPRYSPNIVPLLDVLFLLLLFFVLAGKFRQDEGMIPGSLPPPPNGPPSVSAPPVILEVRGDGRNATSALYSFFGESDSMVEPEAVFRQLKLRFDSIGGSNPADEGIVVIKYYGARWQFIVDAYNQAARAGYRKISFQQG